MSHGDAKVEDEFCRFVVGEQHGEPVICGAVRSVHGDALGMAAHGFLSAFDVWAEGTRYTHEHYRVDPTQFVGHTPAAEFRECEQAVLALVPSLRAEVESLQRENADLRLGARKVQNDVERAVESLQAQLAAARADLAVAVEQRTGFADAFWKAEDALAAVRTDLSVARRQIEACPTCTPQGRALPRSPHVDAHDRALYNAICVLPTSWDPYEHFHIDHENERAWPKEHDDHKS